MSAHEPTAAQISGGESNPRAENQIPLLRWIASRFDVMLASDFSTGSLQIEAREAKDPPLDRMKLSAI